MYSRPRLLQHRQDAVCLFDPGDRLAVARQDARPAYRFVVRIRPAVEGDLAAVGPLTDLVPALNRSGDDVVGLYARHRVVGNGGRAFSRSEEARLDGEPGGFDFPVDAGGQIDLLDCVAARLGELFGEFLDAIEAIEDVEELRRVWHARDSTDANSDDHRQKCRELSREQTTAVSTVRSAGAYVSLRATMSYRR
jgi:hypothetical protein